MLLLVLLVCTISLSAQEIRFVTADQFDLLGQDPRAKGSYHRFEEGLLVDLPERVRELSFNTSGFYLDFESNSSTIALKWEVDQFRQLMNMTPIAVNGFDLYGQRDGSWQFIAAGTPRGTTESQATLIANLKGDYTSYRLYFPLYTGVERLEIGIDSLATIRPVDPIKEYDTKVLIYGSSITQGASASRPGMAFPSILSRILSVEFLNFGFSGSGKMELEVAKALSGIQSDLIILDCVPNPSPEQIAQRAVPFIKTLRKAQPDTPILMVEGVFRENARWNEKLGERVVDQNKAFREAYQELQEAGMDNLFYISQEGHIGSDHEGTIDGVHFSDLGHYRMAQKLAPYISEILEETAQATPL